jgi:hypothetical protein
MKWTIRIELTPEGNEPITRDVGTITRPIADLHPEQAGLSPEEDRQVVLAIPDYSSGSPVSLDSSSGPLCPGAFVNILRLVEPFRLPALARRCGLEDLAGRSECDW